MARRKLTRKEVLRLAKQIEKILPEYAENFSDTEKDEWYASLRYHAVQPLENFVKWLRGE